MNKIVIFGSTGQTGLCAIESALKKGISVRAFVRDPTRLPENLREKVEVIKGDALNYTNVLGAVKDCDGVVVTLGTGHDLKPTTDMSEGLKNIVKAMTENSVEHVAVCLSAFLFYEPEKVPKIFVDINADHQRMFNVLKESGLKYVAVFPPHISDEPSCEYKVQHDASPGRVISKYDLGDFLVSSLSQTEHHRKVCGLAKVPTSG